MFSTKVTVLAVCAVICASQPVEKLPVLKGVSSLEIPIRTPDKELVVECVTVDKDPNVKYTWQKDGKPYAPPPTVTQREHEGTLVFKQPTRSDEGQYKCLAITEYGTASSPIITLKKYFLDPPTFTLKKHKPVEGKTFQLDCAIPKSYPKPEIAWIRKSIADPNDSKMLINQRLTVNDEGTLFFSNVTKEDASPEYKYMCVAIAPDTAEYVTLAEHVLEEVVADKGPVNNDVIEQYVTNDKTVKAGEFIYLYCIYGGNPLAHPDWFKDGKDVNNGVKDRVTRHNRSVGKRLVIKEVWVSDEGDYTCNVDNEVGKPQKHTMHLTVVSAPQFLRDEIPKLVVKSGQDVTVPCTAAGIPNPELTWTYNTQPLLQNDKIVLNKSSQGNTTVSDLTIKNVQKGDKGYYGCRAHNEHGDIYTETLVYVQ